MAANRYGQIWHGDHHHINIRFPSAEARLKFQNEFEAHHASHDHEGDVPTFIHVTTKDLKLSTGSRSPQDLVKAETDKDYRITIDGYSWNEIHEYHNPSGFSKYFWYHVPTCCVPPTIVVDREFVDSGTLQRHELSAIFEDMPVDDFQSLLESVRTGGFIDPIVRIYEGHILDGWHRYRAAQELNLIRKLRFQEWDDDADRDGDPRSFVLARNLNRRHLTPAQRAQIVLEFNDWAPRGRPSKNTPNGVLKTKKELAKEARVGTSTMDRAAAIKESGQSEVVIRGDKTPGQLEREAKEKRYAKLCKAINAFNRVWQKTQLATQVSLSDDFFPAAAEAIGFPINTVEQVYRCQDSPESEKKMKGFTGLGIGSWEQYFDEMRMALIEKPEWVESLESGTHTEAALEQLYQNRQDFQTTVSDFAQSGKFLDFAYCRRRIKELIGLEDSTDEGSTDYTHWDLQKIKVQSQIAEESVLVIKGYMDEDPKIEGYPVATLLSEMQRISEIHQSAKLDTYTRPFLHQPLSDAVERIEKLWTADWEAKSAEERLDDLNELEAELPGLIEAEDTAQTDVLEQGYQQKKQKAKLLWDTRIQAARDYTGDTDTDLNLHLTLPELEEGFQKNNPHYALHFASAMKRTSETSFNIMLEKILISEDVTLEVLETEHRALMTYAGDVRQWQRPDWLPDTNWILPLIEAKKAKAADAKKTDAADTLKTLREQITPAIAAWKSERKGQGVGYASKTMFIEATKRFHDLPQESETDVDLLEKLLSLLTEVQGRMYTFERYVKMQCDGASIWADSESDTETSEALPLQDAVDEMKQEADSETTQHKQTLVAIDRLKDGLKKFHVIDIEEFVDDILHFYNGIGVSELSTSPAETLKNITDFIEGFVDEPPQAWPEYIRNHRWVPKRELVLVSIGISNNTDDEFELVEFTDEGSDEISCDLNELPEDLRTALLKIASEKIYAEAVKEFHE